jgi:HEPN domain-containing protein
VLVLVLVLGLCRHSITITSTSANTKGEGVSLMLEEWSQATREHLRAAELLLKEGLHHLACFHSQRAAAQALRAVLEKNGVPAPGEVPLLELLGLCETCDREAVSLRGACALLDLYLTAAPHPALPGMLPWGQPTHEQAAATIDAARQVVQTLGRLSSPFALAAVA